MKQICTNNFDSWGRFPKISHLGEIAPRGIFLLPDEIHQISHSLLPRGLGRSYGDSCLNGGGYLLSTKWLNKFHAFDPKSGILRCESGVTFDEILQIFVPRGWFLPISPGTKFVTVGGAIANDIHGKNHHRAGSFGNCLLQFELLRSDGEKILCSRENNSNWFRATIGGLGLTGIILWAEFGLKPIKGPYIDMESIRFKNLDEFYAISKESHKDYEYSIAWLDCLTPAGRGIFMRGNHAEVKEHNQSKILHKISKWKSFPIDAPPFLLSILTIKAFNFFFYHKEIRKYNKNRVHYDPFFYPLDTIHHWNRIYGRRGFLQWQAVLPTTDHAEAISGVELVLKKIAESKMGSFLTVLKEFGGLPSEGMLSFPMQGITIALDFPNVGERLFTLLDELDEIVINYDGRIYPAKDARMSSGTFRRLYPEFENFTKYIDPKFSSNFYRRIGGKISHDQSQ